MCSKHDINIHTYCLAYISLHFHHLFHILPPYHVIPQVHSNLTSRRVITTDWVDGVKLASAPKDQIRDLIPVGVELFLTQLLDIGAFHADPVSYSMKVYSFINGHNY